MWTMNGVTAYAKVWGLPSDSDVSDSSSSSSYEFYDAREFCVPSEEGSGSDYDDFGSDEGTSAMASFPFKPVAVRSPNSVDDQSWQWRKAVERQEILALVSEYHTNFDREMESVNKKLKRRLREISQEHTARKNTVRQKIAELARAKKKPVQKKQVKEEEKLDKLQLLELAAATPLPPKKEPTEKAGLRSKSRSPVSHGGTAQPPQSHRELKVAESKKSEETVSELTVPKGVSSDGKIAFGSKVGQVKEQSAKSKEEEGAKSQKGVEQENTAEAEEKRKSEEARKKAAESAMLRAAAQSAPPQPPIPTPVVSDAAKPSTGPISPPPQTSGLSAVPRTAPPLHQPKSEPVAVNQQPPPFPVFSTPSPSSVQLPMAQGPGQISPSLVHSPLSLFRPSQQQQQQEQQKQQQDQQPQQPQQLQLNMGGLNMSTVNDSPQRQNAVVAVPAPPPSPPSPTPLFPPGLNVEDAMDVSSVPAPGPVLAPPAAVPTTRPPSPSLFGLPKPTTVAQPVASTRDEIALHAALSAVEFEELYKSRHEGALKQIGSFGTDPSLRKQRRQIDKQIKIEITQVAGSIQQVTQKSRRLNHFFDNLRGPEQYYAYQQMARSLVSKCDGLMQRLVFPLSEVIMAAVERHPKLLDMVLAMLHKTSVLTVPKYYAPSDKKRKAPGLQEKMGYREVEEGERERPETDDEFIKRQTGYIMMYAGITQASVPNNPHGLSYAWRYLSRLLNNMPPTRITGTALETFLRIAGYSMFNKYRNQFIKVLQYVDQHFLVGLANSGDEEARAVYSRLHTYLTLEKFREEPEGRRMPNVDQSQAVHT